MELRALRGRPVISVDSGERLGEIADVSLDPQQRRIAALQVRRPSGDLNEVAFTDVHSIGSDAVMVPTREVLRVASEQGQSLLDIDAFLRLRVVTEQGEARGTVDDAEFDPASGSLTAVIVAPAGLAAGLLGRRQTVLIEQVRTIGRDTVVLAASPPPGRAGSEAATGSGESE